MQAYQAEWAAFVQVVINQDIPPITLEDAVTVLTIAEAATRSLHSSQPVRLADV